MVAKSRVNELREKEARKAAILPCSTFLYISGLLLSSRLFQLKTLEIIFRYKIGKVGYNCLPK